MGSSLMKAVFIEKYGSPDQALVIKNVSAPIPKDNELLIQVKAFGINYADIMARQGMYKDAPPAPFIPGYEVSGIVAQTGKNITRFAKGDRVLAFTRFGGYAQQAVADERAVVKIPENLTFTEATHLATQFCTAYYAAYWLGNIKENEIALVHAAAGGVGTALCQLLKLKNCTIYGTASRPHKIAFLEKEQVIPINYIHTPFDQYLKKHKVSPDIIFDSIGGQTYKKGRKILSVGGRIIAYGGAGRSKGGWLKTLQFGLQFGFIHPVELLMKSQSAMGVNMLRIADHKPSIIQKILTEVINLYEADKIHPVIDKVFTMQQISEAHKYIESRNSIGKIAVKTESS